MAFDNPTPKRRECNSTDMEEIIIKYDKYIGTFIHIFLGRGRVAIELVCHTLDIAKRMPVPLATYESTNTRFEGASNSLSHE